MAVWHAQDEERWARLQSEDIRSTCNPKVLQCFDRGSTAVKLVHRDSKKLRGPSRSARPTVVVYDLICLSNTISVRLILCRCVVGQEKSAPRPTRKRRSLSSAAAFRLLRDVPPSGPTKEYFTQNALVGTTSATAIVMRCKLTVSFAYTRPSLIANCSVPSCRFAFTEKKWRRDTTSQ